MAKQNKPLKPQQVIRKLRKLGFTGPVPGGRHVRMVRIETGQIIPIPMHEGKDVSVGLIRAIIREVGVTPWWLPFGRVPEISARELNEMIKDGGAQLVDVRTSVEFAAGHVAGARSVPIYALKQALPSLALDPNRPIVVICATAHRSPPAVRLLRAAGYENAVQLKGGMLSWYAARLPTSK